MNIQELARQWVEKFEWAEREGRKYLRLKEEDPELTEIIREIHQDRLPNDFIYQEVWESLCEIAESDGENLNPEKEPDTYYKDLWDWFGDLQNIALIDEVLKEKGINLGIMDIIGIAQQREKERIYFEVIKYLNERAEF